MEKQFAELSHLAMMLLLFSVIPFVGFLAYIFFKSGVFAPIYLWRANRAFEKKTYKKAAKLYAKMHDFEAVRKGNVYAKKAAQSHELSGALRLAREWYTKARDYAKVGALMVEAGQINEAIALYKEENLPQRLVLLYEDQGEFLAAADLYHELKQPRKEESVYRKAIFKGDPLTIQTARLHLALLSYQQRRHEEANRFFEEALAAIAEMSEEQVTSGLLKLRDDTAFSLQRHDII